HAVEARDGWASVVDVAQRVDADAYIEPSVAIEHVVAGAPHHEIAAATAENNIAGGERRNWAAKRTVEKLLQTVDQRDVGERRAAGRRADLAADQIDGVIAIERVIVLRARDAFHNVKAGKG